MPDRMGRPSAIQRTVDIVSRSLQSLLWLLPATLRGLLLGHSRKSSSNYPQRQPGDQEDAPGLIGRLWALLGPPRPRILLPPTPLQRVELERKESTTARETDWQPVDPWTPIFVNKQKTEAWNQDSPTKSPWIQVSKEAEPYMKDIQQTKLWTLGSQEKKPWFVDIPEIKPWVSDIKETKQWTFHNQESNHWASNNNETGHLVTQVARPLLFDSQFEHPNPSDVTSVSRQKEKEHGFSISQTEVGVGVKMTTLSMLLNESSAAEDTALQGFTTPSLDANFDTKTMGKYGTSRPWSKLYGKTKTRLPVILNQHPNADTNKSAKTKHREIQTRGHKDDLFNDIRMTERTVRKYKTSRPWQNLYKKNKPIRANLTKRNRVRKT